MAGVLWRGFCLVVSTSKLLGRGRALTGFLRLKPGVFLAVAKIIMGVAVPNGSDRSGRSGRSGRSNGSGVLCIMEQIASKLLHFIFGVAGLLLAFGDGVGTSSPAGRGQATQQGEDRSPGETSHPTGRGQAIAPTMDRPQARG